MSKNYQIGQFRKNSIDSYMSDVDFSLIEIKTIGMYSSAVTFIDNAISLKEELIPNQSYYLNFSIQRNLDSDQKISVYLKNSLEVDGDCQNLYTYTIKKGSNSIWVPFELIITPVNSFDQIVFELQRVSEDYAQSNKDGTHGRKINIRINYLTKLYNILNYLGLSKILKIGVQGPSGLLMSINGEEIRVGKSGIYEMAYPIAIDSICFVIKDSIQNLDGQDYFIMDYQY